VAVYLASDLHLGPSRPDLTEDFLSFLARVRAEKAELYLLGDLFEAWVGDDDPRPYARRVAEALRATSAVRPVRFLHGNRDFLLGRDYARRSGLEVLPDPWRTTLAGVPTVLTHGDILCTEDRAYQRFRLYSRDPARQARFLARPFWWRRSVASLARARGRLRRRREPPPWMDVQAQAVEALLADNRARRLVHGHTHRPGWHRFRIGDEEAERIVLGPWDGEARVLVLGEKDARLVPPPL